MKVKNVKVGQRVELKVSCSNRSIPVGATGTCLEDYNDCPFVQWDDYGDYAVDHKRLRKLKE